MYLDKHLRKRRPKKRSSLIIAFVLVALVVAAVGTTMAYISHSSNSVNNTFSPSEITCEVVETVNGSAKSSVKVQNTGKTEAFIRVAVIANTVDEEGNITGPADVSEKLGSSSWRLHSDGFYYYTKPVAPGVFTGELLADEIDLKDLQVTILAEAIQSEPASAAKSAWDVNPASLEAN